MLINKAQERVLVANDQQQWDYPHQLVHQFIEQQVERTPDATAVIFEDKKITYSELNDKANRVAVFLRNNGIGPDSLVGVCLNRSIELVIAFLGILKAGGAYVPLDPDFPTDRLAYMLEDCDPTVLIMEEVFDQKFPNYKGKIIKIDTDWSEIAQHNNKNLNNIAGPDNLSYIIYTSGSTGKPKGVEVMHKGIINLLEHMRDELEIKPQDTILMVSPISFDLSVMDMLTSLISGATVLIVTRKVATNGPLLKERLDSGQVTFIQATPSTWRMVLEAGWQGNKKIVIATGAESLPRDLANNLIDRSACVWNLYGPTEASVWATSYKVEYGDKGSVPVGKPIRRTKILILNESNQPVKDDEIGELLIGGIGVARGYHNRAELNAEKFIANPLTGSTSDRFYRTGDLARYRADGNVEFLGRSDFQVKVGGYRIELEEIEITLRKHPQVQNSVVMAAEDNRGEKRLVAYIEFKNADKTVKEGKIIDQQLSSELRSFLKQTLAEYMVPPIYVSLSSFPLTPSGKIDRKSLPNIDSLEVTESKQVAPRDALEFQLRNLFAEILNIPAEMVGLETSFFDLGGGSITTIRLANEIENRYKFQLPLHTIYQHPTVSAIAKHLTEQNNFLPLTPIVIIQPGKDKDRIPFFFIHGAGGVIFHYYNLAYQLGEDQPFFAIQDPCLVDPKRELYSSIQEMATDYIKAIKTVRPHGPYMIGGHSFGGLVSLEMTNQLMEQGEEVILLAACDTPIRDNERRTFKQKYIWYKRELLLRYEVTREILPYIVDNIYLVLVSRNSLKERFGKEVSNGVMESIWGNALFTYFQSKADLGEVIDKNSTRYFNQQPTMRRATKLAPHHLDLMSQYRPKTRFSGAVKHFRASEYCAVTGGKTDATLGWDRIAENVENIWVEGSNHHNMLRKPYIEDFAKKLKAEIDKVCYTKAKV